MLPTKDFGGLISSLSFIQFGMIQTRMTDLVIEDLILWLKKNGNFVYQGRTLSELAKPLEWDQYISLIENGLSVRFEETDESLKVSSDDVLQKRRFADFFVLVAFAQVYSITIICVTDASVEGNEASPNLTNPEWGPFVYSIEPQTLGESNRIAILGISNKGRCVNPLLPQSYWESLQRTISNN